MTISQKIKEFEEKFNNTETCDMQRFETSKIERERIDCFCGEET